MPIERAFVAGAGLMGHGIAQVLAAAGRTVDLYEPDLARAAAGRGRIAANLERSVAKGRLDATARVEILDRIAATDRLAAAAEADFVLEAIFEDEAAKRVLWASIDARRARQVDLRHEHQLDLDRPPRGRARSRAADPPSAGCTSSAPSRSCPSSS